MGSNLRRTGLFQKPVVCVAGNLFFYFLYDIDAGNLGRTILFSGTGIYSAVAVGRFDAFYPDDSAESIGNGPMEQPGHTGSGHGGGLYVYLLRTKRILLV